MEDLLRRQAKQAARQENRIERLKLQARSESVEKNRLARLLAKTEDRAKSLAAQAAQTVTYANAAIHDKKFIEKKLSAIEAAVLGSVCDVRDRTRRKGNQMVDAN
jgi:hypothetical protein